ncbi:YxeA family protein [Burkholderia cepacia]|uniref:YxeA family protein n=1 Tax=Burkholderia cepacia TaxID=292 RepID=UPI000B00D058|nr:YxeA family protein [Burkholderia cepacia]
MKRLISLKYFAIAAIIFSVFLVFNSHKIIKQAKRWGAEQCYVKISSEAPNDDGSDLWQYAYQLDGYSSNGAKRILKFRADRILRHNAYLRVYVLDNDAVVSWEEISSRDVPAGVQKYLN